MVWLDEVESVGSFDLWLGGIQVSKTTPGAPLLVGTLRSEFP